MSESVNLMQLQDIDLQLLKLASNLASMPQVQKIKNAQLAEKKIASQLKQVLGVKKDVEIDISDLNEQRDHYVLKTDEVSAAVETATNHRALRDFDQQLSSLAKNIEKCDFKLAAKTEELEKCKKAYQTAQDLQVKLMKERESLSQSLEIDSAALRAEIVELSKSREELAAQISSDTLERYEAARKRFKGLAVEHLVGNVPSVCRVKLQPSSFHDLQHSAEIAECPYCHRMLITSTAFEE